MAILTLMRPIYLLKNITLLLLIITQANAQTPVVTVASDYSYSPTGISYTLGGNNYYYGNQSGTINNIQTIVGFSLPDGSYYYNVFVAGQIKIRRVDNPVVSGRRCLVWVEAVETAGNYRIMLPYIDSMELFFNGQTLNKGTDNLFGNQGDGSGNNNNIERVDWVVFDGMSAANPAQSGFPIFERGADNAHDPFCIAAITGVDVMGNPTAYGPIVRVATTDYGNMANSNMNWSILRKEQSEPLLYRTTAGVQRRGGVFISMADLGVAPDELIFGYSLFAHDLPAGATPANLLNYTNAAYFPTNTSSNTTLGGIDLIAIAGLYNITDGVVLPVTCTNWEAKIIDRKATLSWGLQNGKECRFIEVEKSTGSNDWKRLGQVTADQNSYVDRTIEKNAFYRLKLYAHSGKFAYSSVKKLSTKKSLSLVSVIALPQELNIIIENPKEKKVSVSVYNSEGKKLLQQVLQLAGKNARVSLPYTLIKGIYIVEINDGVDCISKKVAVQ